MGKSALLLVRTQEEQGEWIEMQRCHLNAITSKFSPLSKIWPSSTLSSGTVPNHSCKSIGHFKGPVVLRDKHTALTSPSSFFCYTLSEFYSLKMRGILPNQALHSLISFFLYQENIMHFNPAVPLCCCVFSHILLERKAMVSRGHSCTSVS